MNKKVFVVIPVHNRVAATESCLACLSRQTYSDMMTVVVDDGSTDGTWGMLEQRFPEVVRLQGDGTLWWTGGINMGIEYALKNGADLLVTLNNDVIVNDDYIQNLVEAHHQHPAALIGSINLTQETPPRLLFAGVVSHNHWTAKNVQYGQWLQVYNGEFKGIHPSYSLPGRGTLIPRAVFDKIGLFDEKYFRHYAADVDYSLRAAEAGFRLLIHLENPVFSSYEPNRPGGAEQSLVSFIKSFGSFRTAYYLPVLFRYDYRHAPRKWYAVIHFLLDVIRLTGAYARNRLKHRGRATKSRGSFVVGA